jgi:hypothetical protein
VAPDERNVETMGHSNRRRRLAVLVGSIVGGVGLLLTASSPAYAWNVDRPRITDDGVDFGGSVYSLGVPVGGGHLHWRVGPPDHDIVSPELDGTMHLNNMANHCGRMHMSVWDEGGDLMTTGHSPEHCVDDNSHESWPVTLRPLSSEEIGEVHICTEVRLDVAGADWDIIGCETAVKDLRTQ